MGSILASAIVLQAQELAQDDGGSSGTPGVTWTDTQGLAWLNDGQRAVALVRPDASVRVSSVKLSPGTKQTIAGHRLMAVIRNMGSDGVTPGRAVRLTERGAKDEFDPDWHKETAATEIKEYIYDERVPKEYYVSPPVNSTTPVYAEISESVAPADVADLKDPITLDDNYAPALIEWVAYRFFSRDAEELPDIQRAIGHFQRFFNMLGEKLRIDLAISPKVRSHLE